MHKLASIIFSLSLLRKSKACSFFTSPGSVSAAQMITPQYNASYWNASYLSASTKGQCNFLMNTPVLENFAYFNTTLWDITQSTGDQHCSGLAPAGPGVCTIAALSQLQFNSAVDNTTMPAGRGLTATLSQTACTKNLTQCAYTDNGGGQSFWLGAHMQSLGCAQWGYVLLCLCHRPVH